MVRDTSVNLCGIRLQNPVIPASGTFGQGFEMARWYALDKLGAICLKGTTLEPRFGNPTPRIAECTGGLLNAVGLQNPGIDALVSKVAPHVRSLCHTPLIANISGFSVEEFGICCEKADACEEIDLVEVNISCPNVHKGGMRAVAIATPERTVPFSLRESSNIPAIPPKKAMKTSYTEGLVRAINSVGLSISKGVTMK